MKPNPFTSLVGAVIPALYTCFRPGKTAAEGKYALNVTSMRHLVCGLMSLGMRTFYLLGSTGQGMFLSEEFRMDLTTRMVTGHKSAKFIIHVGAKTVEEAVRLAKHVANLARMNDNIVGISAKPPETMTSDDEVFAYHAAIAQAAGKVPYMAYFIGEGIDGSVDAYAQKLVDAGATAVKFTSSKMDQLEKLVEFGKTNDRLLVFSGDDPNVLEAAKRGAAGSIGSTDNYLGDHVQKARDRVVAGDASFDDVAFTDAYHEEVDRALDNCGSRAHLYADAREAIIRRFNADIGESVDPVNLPMQAAESEAVGDSMERIALLAAA